ncbi:class I SAM-dependent methyltransferase [Nocardioides cynanchi]|uniref:class I SAM-dependent methyltransferase n=1 Tax=Nocardioides cynanchi TaxID=2558918 RepID=UPI0012487B53|nr:class I SAM-dependent methyltransferase [Nocardioides cynanchi]
MTDESFDRDSWERRWDQVQREHSHQVAARPPSATLRSEVAGLPSGRALDAGCGHGAESLWLAGRGWQVTAVDFSRTALDLGRTLADAAGPVVADRITWVEGDLGRWTPEVGAFDLVSCLYVHVTGSVDELIRRLGAGVTPGGTLLLVGHQPVDPATGAPTAAAGQVQVSVADAVGALPTTDWEVVAAEDRPRAAARSGVDAVVRAVRRR